MNFKYLKCSNTDLIINSELGLTSKITPFKKEDSELQFWTRSKDPDKDKNTLIQLYNCGFLQTTPENHIKQFWNAFKMH
ncbi:unnamed protein product [Rhizophagus irregularis]|nr:unnamed protein product [Rhizophagus irregularis]